MIKHKIKVDTKQEGQQPTVVYSQDGETYPTLRGAEKAIAQVLYALRSQNFSQQIGGKGSLNIAISWECTENRRAPNRPKDVLAAEKRKKEEQRAAAEALYAEQEEKRRMKAEIALAELRERVKHQVDHAFTLGKHGTEAAAKFITCQACNSPAAVLGLTQKLSGAVVVDEDQIAGVFCKGHDNQWTTKNWAEKIPTDRLEFFYDGVRQIAVKT